MLPNYPETLGVRGPSPTVFRRRCITVDPRETSDTSPGTLQMGRCHADRRHPGVSFPGPRGELTGDYLEMREEHPVNGSDHRAVITHFDAESSLGMGRPGVPHGNAKLMIRAATPTLEHGEHIDTAQAHADKLSAMMGNNPGKTTTLKDNAVGKRVKDTTEAYEAVKESDRGLAAATKHSQMTWTNCLSKWRTEPAGDSARRETGTPAGPPLWQNTRWHSISCNRAEMADAVAA